MTEPKRLPISAQEQIDAFLEASKTGTIVLHIHLGFLGKMDITESEKFSQLTG